MAELPLGWSTDLAVLDAAGARVASHPDYLVVTSPDNPGYHWGNFLLVTNPRAVDESSRWLATFERHFPRADYRAIGLPSPADPGAWAGSGLKLDTDEVLLCEDLPQTVPLPDGYTVRQLRSAGDWRQAAAADVAEQRRTAGPVGEDYERFAARRVLSHLAITKRGLGAYFGAFSGQQLVADLGIVRCGDRARFQSVSTDIQHRRRGLAGHLLGVAAVWAREHGASEWVILSEPESPAGRLYRKLGFVPVDRSYQAYRGSPPPTA